MDMLKGRRVIVVNSSYETFPDADVCFFGDNRWWEDHKQRDAMVAFKGRVFTAALAAAGERLHRMRRINPPPGLADAPDALATQRTSLQGAMNLAVHFGVRRIVLLGADMGRAPDGSSHHHSPHKWPNKPGNETWDIQMAQFRTIVEPLKARGVDVVNTSPDSRLPWWPKRLLSEVV
ncbi:hypothetical protein JQ608_06675 [Bradyrhizobium liaoningense]|uniref:hypothetical protein n=1 Tax=Bradyrhizobium liaoningense TaxID=43992 RepID=UPI001BA8FE5E|nr:hypothetical protein [Bradyrhizobium liaoningense]MBR0876885.1 hypothetical protein [Bradyrhizobium liaoningense]